MDKIFIIRVIISFFIAGIWIAGATLLAERLGSKLGGLVTNLPSNILISLIFVVMVNGIPYVIDALPAVPIGMAINMIFLFVFIIALQYGLLLSTIISLLIWFGLAIAAAFLNYDNLFVNVVFYIIMSFITFIVLEKVIKIPSAKKSNKKYTPLQMFIRAVFAGSIVASVVVISKFFDAYILGIFSTFPAVLLSTMVILGINQGKEFAQATGKVLVLSSTNIVVYVVAVYFTFPRFGIILGTVISFICSFLWVCLFLPVIRRIK